MIPILMLTIVKHKSDFSERKSVGFCKKTLKLPSRGRYRQDFKKDWK